MHRSEREARELMDFVRTLPTDTLRQVERISGFSQGEVEDIRRSCQSGPDWLRGLVEHLIAKWDVMDTSERITAMLTIALAFQNRGPNLA